MRKTMACLLLVGVAGCPDIKTDSGETPGPTVEFDPANAIVPFPNDLVRQTGKVSLPAQACESPAQTAVRVGVLNKLDGFGTFESALQVTLSEAVDTSTLAGNVLLYKAATAGVPENPATATPIPTRFIPGVTLRFSAADCSSPKMVSALTLVSPAPLDQKSTYIVVLKTGIKTATGADFQASPTWGLIRQPVDPVNLDPQGNVVSSRTPLIPGQDANGNGVDDATDLQQLDQLWNGLQPMFTFIEATGTSRGDTLVAWAFTTQTVTDPIDPDVAGSLANTLPTTPLVGPQSVTGGAGGDAFMHQVTTGLCPGHATCCQIPDGGPLPCQAVGDVFGALTISPSYQVTSPNPHPGFPAIPGAWGDPVHPTKVADAQIKTVIFIPAGTPPANGWPTLIFGHGLTSSKESLIAIGAQLAAQGIMSVAIDFQLHGDRAIKISDDPAIGCGGTPAPTAAPQCFAPFLSSDLAGTRDNFRQTALDLQTLVAALKACGTTACNQVQVDTSQMLYAGISLGGIMGTLVASSSNAFDAAVLNVPGVGLVDVLENTKTLAISCSLVDALIDAGILQGDKSNLAAVPPTGLCTTDAWKTQPGYLQFSAIARWVLDPADGANYTPKLATRRVLIQEVVDDQVVPNVATDDLGALVGLTAGTADPAASATPPPSAAISAMPNGNHFVKYPTLPANPPFPGNTFAHASLLRPANGGLDGQLGTVRLQTDAIFFLKANQ